jgi:hypothetical protein
MKLLNWTRRFSRRGFLAGGAATIAAVAATSGTVLADAQAAPGAGPAELQPDEVRTLLKFTRDLFPHDRLEDSFYAKAIAPLEEEAAKDPSSRRLLGRGVAQLNRLAIAADGKPYADVPDEKLRVSVIKQIEGSAFFTKVYDTTITSLYNQPEVWPKFGYQGPSSSLGGYVNRGFSDIDWL